MAFNPTPTQFKALKAALFLLALLPFLRMAWLTAAGVPVDPVEFLTHGSGDWALYLLCATLAITPLRRLTGWNWVIRLRRMAGLYTFFYAFMHFTTFLWFDHFFDVAAMWKDVLKRPFITVGFAAFVLLIPLAATSTNAMIKRLGRDRTAGDPALLVDEGGQAQLRAAHRVGQHRRRAAAVARVVAPQPTAHRKTYHRGFRAIMTT
jgi:sulfoxide reductase heme-binding subunit YedZ